MTSAPVNQLATNTWDGENRRTVVQLPSAQSVEWRRAAGAGPGLDGYLQHYLGRPTAIPTTLSLADYVKEVKTGSSRWLKDQTEFRCFEGWQDGYGAFTASFREKDSLVEYIKDQRPNITVRDRCSMNIGDCFAKTAYRTTSDT